MNAVVIGGHTRNIGKTSVMAGLIRSLSSLGWTAVKITQYGHGICSVDGQACGCEPKEHAFVLAEEQDPRGSSDTSRFLAAGARRSLWLRARQGQLGDAFPLLENAVSAEGWVMIESNSIIEFLKPVLYLVVLDSSERDFKPSARRFLDQADALVAIDSRLDARAWSGIAAKGLEEKLVFPVSSPGYFSPELSEFVKQRLQVHAPA
jgi:hypothetical protein